MLKTSAGSRSSMGGRARQIGSFALAAGCVALALATPSSAPASQPPEIHCKGNTKLDNQQTQPFPHGINYRITCDQDVKAFTVFGNRQLEYFDSLANIYFHGQPGAVGDAPFTCEGRFPGKWFGCNKGTALATHVTKGLFSTSKDPCKVDPAKAPLQLWFVVVVNQTDANDANPFPRSSAPFPLPAPKCPTTPPV